MSHTSMHHFYTETGDSVCSEIAKHTNGDSYAVITLKSPSLAFDLVIFPDEQLLEFLTAKCADALRELREARKNAEQSE